MHRAELVELWIHDGERVFGGVERGVEDLESEGLGRADEVAPGAGDVHVTSGRAAWTCAALTLLALARAAAIKAWWPSRFTLRGSPCVA